MKQSQINSKGILSRLMADEGLVVEHSPAAQTASFDIEHRILTLPVYKSDISDDLYNLFISHEVAHALFTPKVEYLNWVRKNPHLHTIFNVVEDARINRKIHRRFPGTIRFFRQGVLDLQQCGVMPSQTQEEVNLRHFMDRLISKFLFCTYHPDKIVVPFTKEEQKFVDRIAVCETFFDAVDIASDIYDFLKEEFTKTSMQPQPAEGSCGGTSDGKGRVVGNTEEFSEFLESVNNIFNAEPLVDRSSNDEWVYCDIYPTSYKNRIIPYSVVHESISSAFSSSHDKVIAKYYQDTMKRNRPYINHLVKEFEIKKAAADSVRSVTSQTGRLDMSRVHSYRYNDDIFKTVTEVKTGKSHGLIMFLDLSGSMSSYFLATIVQTLVLAHFCRQAQVPFLVMGFYPKDMYRYTSNQSTSFDKLLRRSNSKQPIKSQLVPSSGFRLKEYLSSKMNFKEFNDACKHMYGVGMAIDDPKHGIPQPRYEILSNSTPISETALLASDIVRDFRAANKIDIVNTIFLTDGENTDYPRVIDANRNEKQLYQTTKLVVRHRGNNKVYSSYIADDELYFEMLRDCADVNVVCFHIVPSPKQYLSRHGMEQKGDISATINNFRGYDQYNLVSVDCMRMKDDSASPAMALAQRILLSKFVDLISK